MSAERSDGCLMGIDVGTSSTKGVLVDLSGNLLAEASIAHGVSRPHPGWAEQDPDEMWWQDFCRISLQLTASAQAPVLAVGASGIGPCVAVANDNGVPLRPAILYGIDTRATEEIEEFKDRFGADTVLARCGAPITTQATGPKLAWLRRHEPPIYNQARKVFMASSYLVWKLTSRYVLDHHSASQSVPLYDLDRREWIEEWAGEVAPGIALPELVSPCEVVGTVTQQAADATGLAVGTPVAGGTIDAWAEAVSVGADRPGSTMLMYGTTMFIVSTESTPRRHRSLWGTVGTWPDTWCLAGGMAASGALTSWFSELVGEVSFEQLSAEALATPPGSRGLMVLPYFAGERTPLFDPAARGVIAGLTLSHGRAEIYRALLEATAYGVRHNFEAMADAGADLSSVVGVGGGTKGGLWTQIVSDVTRHPQSLRRYGIGASYGDAKLAGVAIGRIAENEPWNPTSHVVAPNPANAGLYDELYDIYRNLYSTTADIAHQLAAIDERS